MSLRAKVEQSLASATTLVGGNSAVPLNVATDSGSLSIDLLALDAAIERLAQDCTREASIVELRFFAGLSIAEVAEVLDLSVATVKRDWTTARAWLYRFMTT